jgi:hypothetical protein
VQGAAGIALLGRVVQLEPLQGVSACSVALPSSFSAFSSLGVVATSAPVLPPGAGDVPYCASIAQFVATHAASAAPPPTATMRTSTNASAKAAKIANRLMVISSTRECPLAYSTEQSVQDTRSGR